MPYLAKELPSITINVLSATLPHWTRRHSEWQDSCLISPPKLWACHCLLWLSGKWLVWSLESCISRGSQQSSTEHTLASSISLFLPHLTQGSMKNHLSRLQQWRDQNSYPLLGLKKKSLPAFSGSQMWTTCVINFSILTQGFLCLHLLPQNMGSSKVSYFANHRQAGHILHFWITTRPLLSGSFPNYVCLLPLAASAYFRLETSHRNTQPPLSSDRQNALLSSIQVPICASLSNSSLQRWQILELSSIPETHILTFLHCTGGASKAIPVSLSGFIFVNSFSFLFPLLLRYSHPIAQCLWTNHLK